MANIQPVRGTHDLLPPEFHKYDHIARTAKKLAALYGFQEMATPILEFKEVFKRTLGDESDIVSKEMYEITDRGKEDIVLRPEGTAGVTRAVISNGLTQSLPLKFFYEGPMFRYERPQKGRLRQLHQIGVELYGVPEAAGDIEIIALANEILKELGLLSRITLEINTLGDEESRKAYRKHLVDYLKDHHASLSSDSQQRLEKNPLRILDTKDTGDKEILKNAPLLKESLNSASQDMFDEILEGLGILNIPFKINPLLVRGLDYYCHVTFEFTTTDLGAQGAVLAGGRFDALMEMMGGPSIPGTGWAGGIDRLAMMLTEDSLPAAPRPITIVPMENAFEMTGLTLAQRLRTNGLTVEMIYGGNLGKCLKKAHKLKAQYVIIIGEEEVKAEAFTLKDLDSGEQSEIPQANLEKFFKEKGIS